MKFLKRALTLILAIAMATMIFAGCGTDKSEGSKSEGTKEKLVVWLPPIGDNDAEVWKPIMDRFASENNCDVQLEIIPWDNYAEKYATAISAGKGPDVGYMYAEMFPQFIEMKAIEDLGSYLKPEDYENYTYINDGKMMGGLYGLPIEAANPAVLYYNKDILAKLGEEAPKTWEDFRRIAKKATQDTNGDGKIDQWGFAQGWGSKVFGDLNWNWYGFLWQAGGELFSEDLKSVKFNDEHGQKAAQFLHDLNLVDKVVPEDSLSKKNIEMIESTFGPGKAAFAIHLSSTAANMFDKSFPDLNYGFVTALKDEDQKTFASVDQLTLMAGAKNKDLAFKLMQFMLNKESMTEFHKSNPRAPITKDEPYQGDPQFEEMVAKDKDVYRPLVVAPHGVEIYEYLWKQLQRMIQKEATPKEALDEAARYANELLQK
ncbi:ABC-type glycerol-3-phosphate transport system, substrate-binding protein [Clostridium collagenovorans DSM 3089]|uniref:ABC-type glycerol-3-phosphate transport system, substrate-binding protein n=1 Tax=Clostridium collagenovorans DSM 3089 TaxID=1121306 RepID=A0A1M5WLF1_9CLOT|nr:sugar ABC transporter substrate-binding protein [Clostridium collagenovorans]SHH88346.1 ABC-type glycerol-3-phosphate transport system, substrate-binding protein [Clostridium collagenovorans DSM 3089]